MPTGRLKLLQVCLNDRCGHHKLRRPQVREVFDRELLFIIMKRVKITAIRQTEYPDLMEKYENPIEHTCNVKEGMQWVSVDGKQPEGMCPSAWYSMREFVESLAKGEGNFYDGWMKNPMSAMISCNDGFRPFSFYIENLD